MRTARFLIVLLLVSATPARAQTAATATLSGTVSDESGAVVKGATVSLIDAATNTTRTSRTNDEGQYVFTSIAPGTFKVTVSMAGFKQAQTSGFKIDVQRDMDSTFISALDRSLKLWRWLQDLARNFRRSTQPSATS